MKFDGIDIGIAYLAASQCFPKTDYKTKEVITLRDGGSLWQVPIAVPSERELETFEVIVPGKVNPVEGMEVMQPLSWKNLSLAIGRMDKKKWWTLRADEVKGA